MNINKLNTAKITSDLTTGRSLKKIQQSTAENYAAKNISNPFYYKDFSVNKNTVSFKGTVCEKPPKTRAEFINSLVGTNKYTQEEINKILALVNQIIDSDPWEETDEVLLYEMFDSLAKSNINSEFSVLCSVADKICDLEQDDDYIEINPICKGISTICSNLKYDDYRFSNIFIDSYSGLLNCENQALVYEVCDLLKNSMQDVNPDKYASLLTILSRRINGENGNLQNAYNVMCQLVKDSKYTDDDLLDGLLMYYTEKTKIEEISSKLEARKAVSMVYDNLTCLHIPDKNFFEKVFVSPIEELINRGYSPEEIANMLSFDDFCHKIIEIENIKNADPVILSDFIENIPEQDGGYEIMRNYTKGSGVFNDLLSKYEGDLSLFPHNKMYQTDGGYIYTSEEAKNSINELTKFLNNIKLKRDMTVYRGEGIEVLNQMILENGESLGDAISSAMKKNDNERIEEITAEIIGSLIVQDHFMSTAYSKGIAKGFVRHEGGILWQIEVPKGTNAIYADPFNTEHGVETEILLNRGAALVIKDAGIEDGIYTICADLIHK